MNKPLFARQAIFNKDLKVEAYELLFRGDTLNCPTEFDGDKASSHVLLYAFGERRIEDITGQKDAFINFTRNLLVCPPPLPASQLVIEVLEDIHPDDIVLRSLSELKKQGYRIALDDFLLTDHSKLLLPFADIIKIDVLQLSEQEIREHMLALKKPNLQFVAEKIETHEIFKLCCELGFDYFQGYFLAKPQIVEGKKAQQGTQSILQILAKLTANNADFDGIAQVLSSDPGLSFRLLKMVNSPIFGSGRHVESLSQAIAMVGLDRIRNWSTFLLLASNSHKPSELCIISSTRAKFCERLAIKSKTCDASQAFTVGLLSMLDAHLDIAMDHILSQLNLSPELKNSLTGAKKTTPGLFLKACKALEHQQWSDIPTGSLMALGIDESDISTAYTEALCFAQDSSGF
ncbi:EAL and HDOD domain-containing protein [Marinagarivorans algicola]|uniref:EAL and HDOD domain-containing protein n=1 Tax=Marinagarivorans algicola TaxID=1513270 RepID=UPI0006B97729|nr:HDOD domain-containing protein [Marinagarivorans algicola]